MRLLALALVLGAPAQAGSVAPVRAIRAQTVIAAADLTLLDEDTPGAIASIDEAAGLEAKVTLYTGRPILPSQLGPPALVERNQLVRMTYLRGPLAIEAEGRALDRGGPGERVRVMNLASKQIVTGAVAENGSVEVGR
ncbi:MAG: flagellar basal body P-ring formation protein FlgA [Amaricoccus sp.]|nr:flagellar basal body P-ring formation chaperone FlgA [Amaricoccus sp.]MBP7240732.1 flagellar basal body P-ring formation protein FlgA [Amaricoccus sp.]